eukprot:TRINITY_DN958_c0_g3_i1.p1 TRINITY_DN958_c0_g3~~TRINITY_DN958_c0_g3_i1.p1  ORF type:complete len:681 (-),score=178.89 TRINITY_DN958_c0_g3_i1:51-2093(-)
MLKQGASSVKSENHELAELLMNITEMTAGKPTEPTRKLGSANSSRWEGMMNSGTSSGKNIFDSQILNADRSQVLNKLNSRLEDIINSQALTRSEIMMEKKRNGENVQPSELAEDVKGATESKNFFTLNLTTSPSFNPPQVLGEATHSYVNQGSPYTREFCPNPKDVQQNGKESGVQSQAIANMLRVLQNKIKFLETENNFLKSKNAESQDSYAQDIKELQQKFFNQAETVKQKETSLLNAVAHLTEENKKLKREAEAAKRSLNTDRESNENKTRLSELANESLKLAKELEVAKKEIALLEREKEKHLEKNAEEKTQFEKEIETFQQLLKDEQSDKQKLIEDNAILKREAEKMKGVLLEQGSKFSEAQKKADLKIDELANALAQINDEKEKMEQKYESDLVRFTETLKIYEKKLRDIKADRVENKERRNEENRKLQDELKQMEQRYQDLLTEVEKTETRSSSTKRQLKHIKDLLRQVFEVQEEVFTIVKKEGDFGKLKHLYLKHKRIEESFRKVISESQPITERTPSRNETKERKRPMNSPAHTPSKSPENIRKRENTRQNSMMQTLGSTEKLTASSHGRSFCGRKKSVQQIHAESNATIMESPNIKDDACALSEEIFKVERQIHEMKREYQKLSQISQNKSVLSPTTAEKMRQELCRLAKSIEEGSISHQKLRERQRRLL